MLLVSGGTEKHLYFRAEKLRRIKSRGFQLSDLFYNTVGGMIGGLMYYGIAKAKKHL